MPLFIFCQVFFYKVLPVTDFHVILFVASYTSCNLQSFRKLRHVKIHYERNATIDASGAASDTQDEW